MESIPQWNCQLAPTGKRTHMNYLVRPPPLSYPGGHDNWSATSAFETEYAPESFERHHSNPYYIGSNKDNDDPDTLLPPCNADRCTAKSD